MDFPADAEQARVRIVGRAFFTFIQFERIFHDDLVVHFDRALALFRAAGQGENTSHKNQCK